MTTNTYSIYRQRADSIKLALATSSLAEAIVTCPVSGVVSILQVPSPALLLEWTSPLASPSVCKQLATASLSDPQLLAGCILTLLRSYNLVATHNQPAVVTNALLRTGTTSTLQATLSFLVSLTDRTARRLPALDLNYATHTDIASIDDTLTSYTTSCLDILYGDARTAIQESSATSALLVSRAKKHKVVTPAQQAEATLRANRPAIRLLIDILDTQELVPPALTSLLRSIVQGSNLMTLDASLRTKVCDRLKSIDSSHTQKLAALIEATKASVTSVKDELEELFSTKERTEEVVAITSINQPSARLSIADILAAKLIKEIQA